MDWCICNVRQNFKVVEVACVYIDSGEPVSPETDQRTGVTQEKIDEEGVKFRDAIIKVSTSVLRVDLIFVYLSRSNLIFFS